MQAVEFHPLGSIVIVKGSVKKIMIVARGLATVIGDQPKYFDYGGCLYPEGIIGDSIIYFNHEDISKIVHEGYSDEDNQLMIENINEWVGKCELEKGNPYELNKQNQQKNSGSPENL